MSEWNWVYWTEHRFYYFLCDFVYLCHSVGDDKLKNDLKSLRRCLPTQASRTTSVYPGIDFLEQYRRIEHSQYIIWCCGDGDAKLCLSIFSRVAFIMFIYSSSQVLPLICHLRVFRKLSASWWQEELCYCPFKVTAWSKPGGHDAHDFHKQFEMWICKSFHTVFFFFFYTMSQLFWNQGCTRLV